MDTIARCFLVIEAIFVEVVAAPFCHAQRQSPMPDAQIMQEARLAASGTRVDLFEHGVSVDAALVEVAERALSRMEAMLGLRFDEATLGPRIRVYVSAGTSVSHVWRGYHHPSDPRAILFLNPTVARLALQGTNATYAHELAHLITWRYHSHTLREGLADYLALQLHPGAGVGPNPAGQASPPAVPAEVNQFLGTTRPPPAEVTADIRFRRAYYFASYRFVRSLIERSGMAVFMELYRATDPEAEFPRLYGASRSELVAAAAK